LAENLITDGSPATRASLETSRRAKAGFKVHELGTTIVATTLMSVARPRQRREREPLSLFLSLSLSLSLSFSEPLSPRGPRDHVNEIPLQQERVKDLRKKHSDARRCRLHLRCIIIGPYTTRRQPLQMIVLSVFFRDNDEEARGLKSR